MPEITLEQAFAMAVQHHQAGRVVQAEQLYRKILAHQPGHVESLHYLGVIATQHGRFDIAVDLIGKAIQARPGYFEAYSNLGISLRAVGKLDEAIAAFRRAIALDSHFCQPWCNLGTALKEKGDIVEAIAAYRRAIALDPNDPLSLSNLGSTLAENGQAGEAVALCRKSIAIDPNVAHARVNLGIALQANSEYEAAIAAYRQAMELKPDYPEAYYNLASGLEASGQHDQAILAYRQAIALRPDYADAHLNLAFILLSQGNFQQGWREYEWRSKSKHFNSGWLNCAQPQWDGRALTDATLLIHREQGFGDTLQFIRYLPLVRQRAGKIILQCQPELRRLLKMQAGPELTIIANGDPLPPFDVQISLMSLARLFATTIDTIPRHVPYLQADPRDAAMWQHRLAADADSHKVGLVWAGRQDHHNDRNRSLPLIALAPLTQVPGVRFYSLQKGAQANYAKFPPAGMDLIDWTPDLDDFADTAALVANLDLVISVDTSIVHLAGAMGKPVWVMLPCVADWRWLLMRDDSPWYPTMRLFRQPASGDWKSVIERVTEALGERVIG